MVLSFPKPEGFKWILSSITDLMQKYNVLGIIAVFFLANRQVMFIKKMVFSGVS